MELHRLRSEEVALRTELAEARQRSISDVGEYPPGHFHSPIPDMEDVWARAETIFRRRTEIPGIDLRGTNS